MSGPLLHPDTKVKVSSVLNRNVVEFGGKNMVDGSKETCWNSEQGCPQFVQVNFDQAVCVSSIEIMFQGGFSGQVPRNLIQFSCLSYEIEKFEVSMISLCVKDCELLFSNDGRSWASAGDFFPEDSNDLQSML